VFERDSDSRGPITHDEITLQKDTRKISLNNGIDWHIHCIRQLYIPSPSKWSESWRPKNRF